MMGKQNGQVQIAIVDFESMIPDNHLLRKIKTAINFDFIYDVAAPYYANKGRKSIDPTVMIKMLLVGYLYGIKSERRLEEEVSLNLAYRWFCDLGLMDRIPDHSTFSQNRKRRFTEDKLFRDIFNQIVCQCIPLGIIGGELAVADGSFIPANVSKESTIEVGEKVQKSTIQYLDELEEELSKMPGYSTGEVTEIEKMVVKSQSDPDCGYIHQRNKKGLGYIAEMTVDTVHGIVTGVDCFAANRRESDMILKHLKEQQKNLDLCFQQTALDGGYDIGAVHRGLELLGTEGFTAIREYQNNALKKGFTYDEAQDAFLCQQGKLLKFKKLVYKKSTQNYYRLYTIPRRECTTCPNFSKCATDHGNVRINASAYYPAFHRNRQRFKSPDYFKVMRLRKIWAEGTFSVLKREHNLKQITKRGIHRASEECLLSATALNLKRLARALA